MKTRVEVSAAKKVAYQRRLNRTSSIGTNMMAEKLEDMAAAVIAAMRASGTWRAASSCGITKKTIPTLKPTVQFERPISQTGGVWRLDFTLALGGRLTLQAVKSSDHQNPAGASPTSTSAPSSSPGVRDSGYPLRKCLPKLYLSRGDRLR